MGAASAIGRGLGVLVDNIDPKTERLIDSRQEAEWRETIRRGLMARKMTPSVVEAYAGLHLRTPTGLPVRPAAHHRLWLEFLCDDRIPRLLIMAPPEAAKTTWIVSAWAGCRIGFFPEDPILMTSATGPIAKKRTNSLRTQADTVSWQATFRNVLRAEGMPYRQEEFALAPNGRPMPGRLHPTVASFGVDGSITGARGRVILGDDIVTRANAKTPYQRTQVKEFWYSTLSPRLMSDDEPGITAGTSRIVIIGTPYHPDDIYADLQDSGRYVVVKTPALGPDTSQSNGLPYYATVEYPDSWEHETMGDDMPTQSDDALPEAV